MDLFFGNADHRCLVRTSNHDGVFEPHLRTSPLFGYCCDRLTTLLIRGVPSGTPRISAFGESPPFKQPTTVQKDNYSIQKANCINTF